MTQKYQKELKAFAIGILLFQIFIVLMYGFFVRVDTTSPIGYLQNTYPWFQDINVMMVVGFGFLLAVIKNYGWSALGFTFFINALVVQQFLLLQGFWNKVFSSNFITQTITINMINLMQSSFASAAVLISFGAVIGRVGPLQLLIMAIIQTIGYTLNQKILSGGCINIIDYGGAIKIHIFGGYFGLAVSYIIGRKIKITEKKSSADYLSCIFSLFGTLFLWAYWPSFNSGSVLYTKVFQRMISITNTILSLTASCISSFALSIILRGRFSMDDILNTTLAGGVVMGASCSMITNPGASIALGVTAGFVATYGFAKMTQLLAQKFQLYDTLGIHNLHAVPGVIGGLSSAVFVSAYNINPLNIGTATLEISGINYNYQSGIQVAGTFISMGIGLLFGIFTGFIINQVYNIQSADFFEDQLYWQIPEIEQQHQQKKQGDQIDESNNKIRIENENDEKNNKQIQMKRVE